MIGKFLRKATEMRCVNIIAAVTLRYVELSCVIQHGDYKVTSYDLTIHQPLYHSIAV